MRKKRKKTFCGAKLLTILCTLCLTVMNDPFCVFIFHKLIEPDELVEWRKKRDQ